MKLLSLAVLMVACSLCWMGCADPEESIQDVPAEVGNKLREGLRGRGEVIDYNQADDPFIK
jgi:hypothetical protein